MPWGVLLATLVAGCGGAVIGAAVGVSVAHGDGRFEVVSNGNGGAWVLDTRTGAMRWDWWDGSAIHSGHAADAPKPKP
jgi:hypothetical protein